MLLQHITITKNGNILKAGCNCVVVQIERGLSPTMFYCWCEDWGCGEWMNRSEFKIKGEKKPRKKRERKRKNPLKTAEDFLIG